MDMDVSLRKFLSSKACDLRMCLDVLIAYGRRLLHHIAEVPGHAEHSLSVAALALDKEDPEGNNEELLAELRKHFFVVENGIGENPEPAITKVIAEDTTNYVDVKDVKCIVINKEDLKLFKFCDDVDDAYKFITETLEKQESEWTLLTWNRTIKK